MEPRRSGDARDRSSAPSQMRTFNETKKCGPAPGFDDYLDRLLLDALSASIAVADADSMSRISSSLSGRFSALCGEAVTLSRAAPDSMLRQFEHFYRQCIDPMFLDRKPERNQVELDRSNSRIA
jgi:hypothetical protein